jgi:hypothetical protein
VPWPLIIGTNWIAIWNILSSGQGVITGCKVGISKDIIVDWPDTTLSESEVRLALPPEELNAFLDDLFPF